MIPGFIELNDVDSIHNDMHRRLFRLTFSVLPDVTITVPTTVTLPSGYSQWYEDVTTNTRRLYMNFNGSLGYFELRNA